MYESRSLDDLRPDVAKNAKKFVSLCAAQGLPVSIASTVRDQEKQTQYYNAGTGSKLVSFHSVGCGLAFDIYHTTQGYNNIQFFHDCAVIGKRMGFEWGGDWRSPDKPHFQWSEGGKYGSSDILAGRVPCEMPAFAGDIPSSSRYYTTNGVHVVEIPYQSFRLLWWDKGKRTTQIANYFNASFFGNYKTVKGTLFTLPAGHVAADIQTGAMPSDVLNEISSYGTIEGNHIRMTFGKLQQPSTLIITEAGAGIFKTKTLPTTAKYAVSGMPIMENGQDVSWSKGVLPQGWDSSPVYATWHGFLGVKGNTVYYFAFKSTTSNCISTSEAYNKLKPFGCTDIIMLDGGGSFILDVGGTNKAVTSGSRQINTVGMF